MLYKKNSEKDLSTELFKNPTCEYRGTPFWAWNCKLEKGELHRQIDIFKEMGLGGFHMHVRTGMATDYLSDEYMDIIKSCVEKAKDNDMLAWLYDEDRWPSGAAGGLVTKDEEYRARYLLFTPTSYEESNAKVGVNDSRSAGGRNCNGYLLGAFDVVLDSEGYLESYSVIEKDAKAKGTKWYAYIEKHSPSAWFNNQTYVDTLSKKAIERFIEVTHERYNETVSDEFGKTIPAIFTDEPQFTAKKNLKNSFDKHDVTLPWTDDFADTFKNTYNEDIIAHIPELFWELKDNKISTIRYHYHDHVSERFTEAFADTVGDWCKKHGIALTGHMMEEPTLKSQTAALGEAMRSYRGFEIPGIDMLCAWIELTTAKQAQSACHQFGREAVLSELYGVTGWDFDFRGHKLHGDWQAALGVNVRVQHLSWVSMAGEAKRDYPASISYQSPWYTEYSYVEDHFARVNTAITRGKPKVKVAVIHPVESYWLHWGPNDKTDLIRETMDKKFQDVTNWLLNGSIDFDFISESLLPSLCEKGSNPLKVGAMEYDAIVVPDCETMRSTTYERLEEFKNNGGKLIFMGSAPKLENAIASDRGAKLFAKCDSITFDRSELLEALNEYRTVTIKKVDGKLTKNLIYQLREDNTCDYLFIAHSKEPYNKDCVNYEDIAIELPGSKKVSVMNTLNGEIEQANVKYLNGKTIVYDRMYDYDSLLLKIEDGTNESLNTNATKFDKDVFVPSCVNYTLDEDNVLLLDMCEFKVDDNEYHPQEEILRADNIARNEVGLRRREGNVPQPWVITEETPEHTITLKFTVLSEINVPDAVLALEDAKKAVINFNGTEIENKVIGWYVDKSIEKVYLGEIKKGENIITVTLPLGNRTDTEWCYLLGDFGVRVIGREKSIVEKSSKLHFGSIQNQGLPFYGGNITYHLGEIETADSFEINVPHYSGAVTKVIVDGKAAGYIAYTPYKLIVDGIEKGAHNVDIILYTNRHNSFGAVHNADAKYSWLGPDSWRVKNDEWTYEYRLKDVGILTTPIIKTI